MALAETAELITRLTLQDQMSRALQTAQGAVSRFSTGIGAVGGAVNTFKGRIGSLISSPLGLLGFGGALYGVERFMTGTIKTTTDFGREVSLLASVTGLTTEKTSELAGAFHHFGIETDTALKLAGFAEKNLFRLGGTTKAATAFQDKYGFSLRDSSGHLKDLNELLLTSADYFNNKQIPAAQKAAALAAIYSRNWQALIPVLSAGRAGIASVEEEAAKLGLTLKDENLRDIIALRDATRTWDTALGGLKLQIGLVLIPELTKLTGAATSFLANGGREQIVGFFKNLITFGQQAGDVIMNDVVPAFKFIYSGWMLVPKEVRDLIIRGFAADRTIKFLFGFSIAGEITGLLGKLAQNKLIPQVITTAGPIPVFVTNPGFGLPGGGGTPPIVPAAEGAAAVGGLGAIATAAAVAFGASGIGIALARQLSASPTDPRVPFSGKLGFLPGKGPADLQTYLDANSSAVKDNTAALVGTHPMLHGAPGGGHPAAAKFPERKLTDAQLISALAKTSEFGFAGIGTKIEHGPLTGTDPYGKQALALFQQAQFPQQGKTLGEIKRHIIAAQDAQRQFAAKGDTEAVRQLQATIDGLRRLLGSNQQAIQVARTNAFIHSGKLAAIDGRLGVIAAKDASIHITIPVTTNVTVGNVARTLNSYYIASKGSSSAFLSHTL